jgi:predicted RND superfamily exporter protein
MTVPQGGPSTSFHERVVAFALRHPRKVLGATLLLFVGLGSQLPRVKIDTDPENMLPADEGARVQHDQVKRDFTLYDMLVVGVVDESSPEGVFNPTTLAHIHELTKRILSMDGVVRQEVLSLSTVDNVEQGGLGVVRFDWLMKEPPPTDAEALAVRDAAQRIPAVEGTLVSEDGRATAIYVPIESKDQSGRIASEIEEVVSGFDATEQYHVTGLPVAEDTFGAEMFKEMGVAAPLAGLLVLILMWVFFRSWTLVTAPMLVAVATVVATMGLLVGLGFTVHIMSSMIPIFLMPIAVVDSVHILSEFADLYPHVGDRRAAVRRVMRQLFRPMLYTSLTSAAGFASLALTPIPPVRVFGIFVALGIALAFVLTLTFIPAYIVSMSDRSLAALRSSKEPGHDDHSLLARVLGAVAPRTLSAAKPILAGAVVLGIVSVIGISRININDNPVRWFRSDHEIRVADRVLNDHFAGTYNAFLVLRAPEDEGQDVATVVDDVGTELAAAAGSGQPDLTAAWSDVSGAALSADGARDPIERMIDDVLWKLDESDDGETTLWEGVLDRLESAQSAERVFQQPEVLAYVGRLQEALVASGLVGKSTGVTDIVKTVHRELREGKPKYFSIPETSSAVAQTLFSYQSSHRPDDLWHFVTPDFRSANLWLQLTSGDNQHMVQVTDVVDRFTHDDPPPEGLEVQWAGLTYINVVWQQHMVSGMLKSLLGSFLIVFVMMLVLFRSPSFAVLAMLPLTVTIGFIYGVIGLTGKDYDMPVAVLSALTLGLSIDFAIHFLQRARVIQEETGNWTTTVGQMFAEPARAISRNAVLIAIGFLPLLASPLVPYNTVGLFLAAIMAASGVVTLGLLPGVISVLERRLFPGKASKEISA